MEIPEEIKDLVVLRDAAKEHKFFKAADLIRSLIEVLGFSIKDLGEKRYSVGNGKITVIIEVK